jgi:dienelactone hydrolase
VVVSGATGLPADVIRLKDGMMLVGQSAKDGTMVDVFDDEGLKQVVLRDSKIAESRSEPAPKAERFELIQPMTVHAGEMPPFAHSIEATPWDALGRREFSYVGTKSGKATKMTQAIHVLGPFAVRYRGVDGFWRGAEATTRVPKQVVLGLLAKVDRKNQDERLRVGRFLIQAEWYPEAKLELDNLERDFPELEETIAKVRGLVLESESRQLLAEIGARRKAEQPLAVEQRLRRFPTTGVPADVAVEVRNQLRVVQARATEDRALAGSLQAAADALTPDGRAAVEPRLLEILRDLAQAPDVVRERLEPFRAAPPGTPTITRLSLAFSGWVLGPDRATADPASADALWTARDAVSQYLAATEDQTALRLNLLTELEGLRWSSTEGQARKPEPIDLPTLSALVHRMKPPLHDERLAAADKVRVVRVFDDPNPDQPSEYAVWLPPEYHPLRSYPALVVLHGPEGPSETLSPWISEASRRGYVLIAPEWASPSKDPAAAAYRYTPNEHAAVQLALRDALKRFAIDADRVYLSGMLEGGNMAWDFGLAHPDLFAGVSVIAGLPGKYVWAYRPNLPSVPFYIVEGNLTPGENEVVFEQWAKPQIQHNLDILYIRYFNRGLETFSEEIPTLFEWMSSRTRNPAPKQFEAVTAREGDDRFYGVVVREFTAGRSIRPEGADPVGRNIKPAEIKVRANNVLNKLTVDTSGLTAYDVWLSPLVLDFTKKIEVQVNGKSVYKELPKLDRPTAYLDDLRIRGDRSQPYWIKIPMNLGATRPARSGR